MQKQAHIRKGFNFLAPFYDGLACVCSFNYIYASQKWLVYNAPQSKHALIIGGGTGKLLAELVKNKTAEKYYYVDISDKMIALAKSRIAKQYADQLSNCTFICGTYTDIPEYEKFDLVVTPYILDCFANEELDIVMGTLNKHLIPSGTWLFADFNIPENKFINLLSRFIIQLLCIGFNLICKLGITNLPDFTKKFETLGYKPVNEKYFLFGLLTGRVYKR